MEKTKRGDRLEDADASTKKECTLVRKKLERYVERVMCTNSGGDVESIFQMKNEEKRMRKSCGKQKQPSERATTLTKSKYSCRIES